MIESIQGIAGIRRNGPVGALRRFGLSIIQFFSRPLFGKKRKEAEAAARARNN
jgi:hypothetical protein